MANEFMNKWNPTMVKDGELELVTDFGFGNPIKTYAHISEGDTVFVRQEVEGLPVSHVAFGRGEFYDLIFNFMSAPELVEIANKKINPDYELHVKLKNNRKDL